MFFYPKLSKYDFGLFRFLGPGLGNLLFPFARALVYRELYGGQLLSPTWPQIKIGTLVRFERDSRTYAGVFKCTEDYVSGFERQRILLFRKNLQECDAHIANNGDVIVCEGMDDMFTPLIGHSDLIRKSIISILKENRLSKLCTTYHVNQSVAVHIRFGDFGKYDSNISASGASNTRLPIDWYVSMISNVRRLYGSEIRVNVFSDASDSELTEVLKLRNVVRVSEGNAIEHILLLGEHQFLIASGSTFSMWGSFLGQVPTVWAPGQLKQRLLSNECSEFESDILGSGFNSDLRLKYAAN